MNVENLQVELLPARTVMTAVSGFDGSVVGADGSGGIAGDGGDGGIAVSVVAGNINFNGEQTIFSHAEANGGDGGTADGGIASAAGEDQQLVS